MGCLGSTGEQSDRTCDCATGAPYNEALWEYPHPFILMGFDAQTRPVHIHVHNTFRQC